MKSVVAGCVALLFAAAAQAGPYVAVSGGVSHAGYSCEPGVSCDQNDKAFKIVGGYGLNEFFGVEVGYYNLGKVVDSGNVPLSGGGVANINASLKTSGFGFGGAFYLDLAPKWRGIGRVGVTRLKTTPNVNASVNGVSVNVDSLFPSESHWGYIAGVDVGYMLTDKMSVDFGFDFGKHKYRDAKADVTILSIGLTTSF